MRISLITLGPLMPFLSGTNRSSINRYLAELRTVFSKAIQWGYAESNPVHAVKLEKENNQRVRFLTHGEIEKLIKAAVPHLRPIIQTALRTGMRRGEILKLKWDQVNLPARIITVTHTKNQEGKQIPIDKVLHPLLSERPSRSHSEYVFPNRKGKPYRDVKRSFPAAVQLAGIKNFRFHDLRPTFASHLVMNGADLATVKELLGHKDIKMTLRYSHLSPAHKERTIALIEKALAGDTPTDTAKNREGKWAVKCWDWWS